MDFFLPGPGFDVRFGFYCGIANWAPRYHDGRKEAPKAEYAKFKAKLREILRFADGVHLSGVALYKAQNDMRGSATEYCRNFIYPAYREVLAEPEFKDKKLVIMCVSPGHESAYALGYMVPSDGTRTARKAEAVKKEIDTYAFNDGGILSGHGGGDDGLMDAFVNAVATGDRSSILSGVDETQDSLLMGFAAEESRLRKQVIDVK